MELCRSLSTHTGKIILNIRYNFCVFFSTQCVETLLNEGKVAVIYQIDSVRTEKLHFTYLFIGEPKRLKFDFAVLFVHGESAEVHVTGNIVVNPGGISDGAVLVKPQGGWSSVVGWHSQCLGLINEHIRHPELGGFVGIQGEVRPRGVVAVKELGLRHHSSILILILI